MHRTVGDVNRTRYARSGALRIAYELRGAVHRRRPWLVLIQGMGLDRLGWEPVLRKLQRRFRLVLVDNRGVGHSDRPARSPSPPWPAISSRYSTPPASPRPTCCSSGRTRTGSRRSGSIPAGPPGASLRCGKGGAGWLAASSPATSAPVLPGYPWPLATT